MWKPLVVAAAAALWIGQPARATIIVTQTTSSALLSTALQGSGVVITSATATHGSANQFGTYNSFSQIYSPGVVLSTGFATDTAGPPHFISSQMGSGGTTEFNTYGSGHITNFNSSNDVARLTVTFTLASASAVAFDFIFGSMEYPQYTNSFTDAFLAFLDGTAVTDQVSFDANNNPVQVGTSFGGQVHISNTETAFGITGGNPSTDYHGYIGALTTTTGTLSAGTHTLTFEVGDVNDQQLDSAVFLANLRTSTNDGGPITGELNPVPEPATMTMLGMGVFTMAGYGWRRRKAAAV
jgi:hypothetical protein